MVIIIIYSQHKAEYCSGFWYKQLTTKGFEVVGERGSGS